MQAATRLHCKFVNLMQKLMNFYAKFGQRCTRTLKGRSATCKLGIRISIHPSYPILGQGGAGVCLAHWFLVGLTLRNWESVTPTFTPGANPESAPNPTFLPLDRGRKPEHLENANPTQEGPSQVVDSNPGPPCSEVTVQTSAPACCIIRLKNKQTISTICLNGWNHWAF